MKRQRGPRLTNGVPRGGLGRLGWFPSLGSFALACFVPAAIAFVACLLLIPICVWCAVGLRRDDVAGEYVDHYVDDESLDLKEMLSGNFEHPVRRQSSAMVFFGVLGSVIAGCRWLWGWGPLF
jgi:hypothetical protein